VLFALGGKMKKLFVSIAMISATNAWAITTPIEPVLVPVIEPSQNINLHMSKYEVTVKEFTRFVNATNYQIKDKCHLYNEHHLPEKPEGTWDNEDLIKEPYRPVVCIGGNDAMAYAKWLAETTGKPYRLPEFNEWQFAASAGKKSRFPFGDDLGQSEVCDYENIEDIAANAGLKQHHNQRYRSSANCNDGAVYHTVVGMYRPNDLGLFDMMGNVRELMQTCKIYHEDQPEKCKGFVVGGSGWHWVPRPTNESDVMPFIGSIEGFRLVLDSANKPEMSKETEQFIAGLSKAQQKAKKEHQRLKQLPNAPTGVRAHLLENNQVKLTWSKAVSTNATYAVYRGYLDPAGKLSRKMEKVSEGITETSFVDQLPGAGAASYQIFAQNTVGESLPSATVHAGNHQTFHVGEQIQAESYYQHRNSVMLAKDERQSVLLSTNKEHYTPGLTPFIPAWAKYKFESASEAKAQLTVRARGGKGAELEFWQGNNLVAKLTLEGSREFTEQTIPAQLIASEEPLQIRQSNKQYIVIDWFKIHS